MFGITFPATVTRVLDGDTVEVEVRRTLRIRLLDCWAPELKQEGGPEAKHALIQLCQDKPCTVHVPIEEQGKFGDSMTFSRILARVEVDGKDISATMVSAGHATKTKKG